MEVYVKRGGNINEGIFFKNLKASNQIKIEGLRIFGNFNLNFIFLFLVIIFFFIVKKEWIFSYICY